ncbi:MAG TPA: DoxX family protein [Polyangiaceae bacterium]|jgi:hypothetical protein|nr:DoxX family protein [Polyangiaceae bacterium]
MQTIAQTTQALPGAAGTKADTQLWIGRVLRVLVVMFMAFDGTMKIAGEQHVVKAMGELGWPRGQALALGLVILVCTALYAIRRTSVLGAILLTGFLGGATAAKARVEDASLLFSVFMGVLVWASLYFRYTRVRALLRFGRD